jgi:hypothetical protein
MSILAFQNPVFQPSMRIIIAITQATACLVTTSFNHNYAIGLIVRLDIPYGFGMQQANQQFGTILTVPTPTTFTLSVDTTSYDTFQLPAGWFASSASVSGFPTNAQAAMSVPIGEDNSILTQAVQNVLPY